MEWRNTSGVGALGEGLGLSPRLVQSGRIWSKGRVRPDVQRWRSLGSVGRQAGVAVGGDGGQRPGERIQGGGGWEQGAE